MFAEQHKLAKVLQKTLIYKILSSNLNFKVIKSNLEVMNTLTFYIIFRTVFGFKLLKIANLKTKKLNNGKYFNP